ncbi:hypothetical protein [Novosphingopyxis sp. YJ-S2-01]|uniref:hypothetical protein n=1 Tax=Novosphingopyxis sp. YJ-S2-01 TaxID=2794021 RepID=UPI0018DE58F6|nr:hypothetical protein [Novosphingopyxis sp. YJ-S2-01]MBH9537497.1 hypothetical protein [Novosphingopyxis sp. YJ-S2-01]
MNAHTTPTAALEQRDRAEAILKELRSLALNLPGVVQIADAVACMSDAVSNLQAECEDEFGVRQEFASAGEIMRDHYVDLAAKRECVA